MISAWNLIWIIPLSILIGMLYCAFIAGAGTRNMENEAYEQGLKDGYEKSRKDTEKNAK